jgi:MFS transporter, PAT family, beta-lactamase induction signal transducer AmpG
VKYNPLRLFGQPKMASLLVLGFASGLPLLLTSRVLQAWMTDANVDLTTIGLFSLAALPYSLKFLWAPLLDRYVPPFLGRRRGWLLITQILLMLAIAALALRNPVLGLQALAINAIVITFLSATQDIAADAYRTDVLEHSEMGAGAATFVLGYRIALLVAGALALFLADRMPWSTVYLLMAGFMVVGIVATLTAPEPKLRDAPPRSLAEAVKLPFLEFFQRSGAWKGALVLIFIVLYKYPESLAQAMLTPFLLETGFTKADLATAQGVIGLVATIIGSLAGGAIVGRIGINKSLWLFGAAQALSNLMYYLLAITGKNTALLYVGVAIEYFAFGLVAAGLVAFLMSVCSMRFSATQYALLSSLMAASRDILVTPGGRIAEVVGWPMFFMITVLVGIPAIAPLPWIAPWGKETPTVAAEHTGETETAGATA